MILKALRSVRLPNVEQTIAKMHETVPSNVLELQLNLYKSCPKTTFIGKGSRHLQRQ